MEKLIKILNEWSNDHTWVYGDPNLLVKRLFRVDESQQRPNHLDVIIAISDATLIVNGNIEQFGLSKQFFVNQRDILTNEIPQEETERLKAEIYDFTSKVIRIREGHIDNWVKAGDKLETTDPLSMK